MMAESIGIPSVTVVSTSFYALSQQLAAAEGLAHMRVAVYPGTISIETDAVVQENIARQTIGQIIAGLTGTLNASGDDKGVHVQ